MTSLPEINDELSAMLRTFVKTVKRLVLSDGPPMDPIDRILAAATLAAGAAAVAWPRGRKLPGILSAIANFGRHLWHRRSWWTAAP